MKIRAHIANAHSTKSTESRKEISIKVREKKYVKKLAFQQSSVLVKASDGGFFK